MLKFFSPRPKFLIGSQGFFPTRGSKESAGLDLYAPESFQLMPGESRLVNLDIQCSFNKGWAAFIWDRSGLGCKGIHRFAGVIDSDYRGDWGVVLFNSSEKIFSAMRGDRIAQVVFQKVWVSGGVGTRSGGFGSTGK